MPHINIKHYPVTLTQEDQGRLIEEIVATVTKVFGCGKEVVSITLEPIAEMEWDRQVYEPELIRRRELLCKTPDYAA